MRSGPQHTPEELETLGTHFAFVAIKLKLVAHNILCFKLFVLLY